MSNKKKSTSSIEEEKEKTWQNIRECIYGTNELIENMASDITQRMKDFIAVTNGMAQELAASSRAAVENAAKTMLRFATLSRFFVVLSETDRLFQEATQDNTSDYIKQLHNTKSVFDDDQWETSSPSEFLIALRNIQNGNPPFMGTNYAQALLALESLEDVSSKRPDIWNDNFLPIKRIAVLFFFAVDPAVKTTAPASLTDEQLDSIKKGFDLLNNFVEASNTPGKEYETLLRFFGLEPSSTPTENAQSLQDEVLNVLPKLQSLIPQKHLIPNNKLANSLTKDIIGAGIIELKVSGKKEPELLTRCILNYEGANVKLSSRQPFTEYDRNVADAVTSLYEYGDASHIITAAQVYRAMVHATKPETPSAQQIGAVTKSLDKMRFVRVQIDCSQELTRRKVSLNGAQVIDGKIDTYLLAMKKIEVTAGGQRVSAYKILEPPILYEYSSLTGQVLTVSADLLDVRNNAGVKVNNTELRIAAKGYLLRRISVMKGKSGGRQSHTIKYSSLYEEVCPGQTLRRIEQQRLRDYIAIVLKNWTWKGFISGYTDTFQGNKKIGVEIKL